MCDKNISISENNNFSCWENKETTKDETEIIKYLKNNLNIIKNKKVLHVGIGNSELGLTFTKYASLIDGITISTLEKNKGVNYNCYRNIHIYNKYNSNDMGKILDNYDVIIDQGFKCYTCCYKHFSDLFKFYIEHLNEYGYIYNKSIWNELDRFRFKYIYKNKNVK